VKTKTKELTELQEQFKQICTRFFDPIETKEFLSNIQTVAEDSNCTVSSLNFSQTGSVPRTGQPETSSYITLNRATLIVVGNYGSIVTLISKLQDRLKQVRIDSLNIEPISNNSALLKCNLTITIYMLQNKEGYSQ